MNVQDDPNSWAVQKFGIGQPVPRTEDPVLVQGHGRYTDDVSLKGQAYAAMVRSSHAHGVIKGIDTEAARAMPGVLAVITGADLQAAGYGTLKCVPPLKNRDGTPMKKPPRPALADRQGALRRRSGRLRRRRDRDRRRRKPPRRSCSTSSRCPPSPSQARRPSPARRILYDDVPNNVALDYHYGDAAKVAAAFAAAAHVTRLALRNNRLVVNPMEPRAAVAEYDAASGHFTLACRLPGRVRPARPARRDILNVQPTKLRVLTGNVGGSFGMKAQAYPEYVCLLHAARLLGRPVKWTDERSESFLSDSHGRDHEKIGRAGARCRGPVPRGAPHRLRQHGRLSRYRRADAADHQRRQEHGQRLSHAADRGLGPVRVHQHHAGRRLSRRRTARRQLLHGAADRHGRGRDGHRPRWSCAGATSIKPEETALRRGIRPDLRQRRFPGGARATRWSSPTGRASPSASARASKRGRLRGIAASAAISK